MPRGTRLARYMRKASAAPTVISAPANLRSSPPTASRPSIFMTTRRTSPAAGEPIWDTALAIELVRRDYFLNAQGGKPSGRRARRGEMPAKTDAIRGIEWLPRIIPKAKAKLRGELPATLMYCCGGDRRFFQAHDIHPAEFLSLVWRNEHDNDAIVDLGRPAPRNRKIAWIRRPSDRPSCSRRRASKA